MLLINYIRKNSFLKLFLILTNEYIIITISTWLSLVLRFETFKINLDQFIVLSTVSSLIYFTLFVFFKCHRQVHRYFNEKNIIFYFKIILFYTIILFFVIMILFNYSSYPRSYFLIQPIIFLLFLFLNRLIVTFLLNTGYKKNVPEIIVYCPNNSMHSIYSFLNINYKIEAFIDSSNDFSNRSIFNIPIYKPSELTLIINNSNINFLFIYDKFLDIFDKKQIIQESFKNKVIIKEIISDNNNYRIKKDIEIGSLFFREDNIYPINLDINSKVVLVTGGAGSIGYELCKQILKLKPKKLIIIDVNELGLFNTENKFKYIFSNYADLKISYVLQNINDMDVLKNIIIDNKIDYVFHTAAYKHVPILENNVMSAFKNNFINTYNLALLCNENSVERFILISSDKAVRPTNIMGSTKRLQELTIDYFHKVNFNKIKKTIFTKVRFGNVLESSGSAIPLFKKQILEDGIVTITHPEITRYFMSIEEAVYLVIQSTSLSKGGETFLLDMGKPIKIIDLVHKMIGAAGLTVKSEDNTSGDIEIKFIGLRPGEKLHEELLLEDDDSPTDFNNIYKSNEKFLDIKDYESIFSSIFKYVDSDDIVGLKEFIKNTNIGYNIDKY